MERVQHKAEWIPLSYKTTTPRLEASVWNCVYKALPFVEPLSVHVSTRSIDLDLLLIWDYYMKVQMFRLTCN